jgi:thiamine transport system substrate-binding protein
LLKWQTTRELDPGNAGEGSVLFLLFLLPILFGAPEAHASCELSIYTYDSIVSRGGLGPEIFPEFEKRSGCKIKTLASGDGVQALSRVELDSKRGNPPGQVLLGVDQSLWLRAKPFQEPLAESIKKTSLVASIGQDAFENGFVPYDYGVLSLMGDEGVLAGDRPHSLSDLTQTKWKKKLILEDPRMSTPGLDLVLFTAEVLGEKFQEFWSAMSSQWLAMPEGWDGAYGLFLSGEAPLVWSYTTSQAYHEEHGSRRYKASLFDEGQPVQIESSMLIKNSFTSREQRKQADEFLNYLLSDEVQSKIAKSNWMLPVRQGVEVPKSFSNLPEPKKIFTLKAAHTQDVMKSWSQAVFR